MSIILLKLGFAEKRLNKMLNKVLNIDKHQIDDLLELAKRQAALFLSSIEQRNTSSSAKLLIDNELSKKGLGTKVALEQFVGKFDTAIVASTGPRYWGFVTGGSTPAAIVGDWLASVYDQNTQTNVGDGDISAIIELETIELVLDLFALPQYFNGGFVTGATQSNFTCLGVARQWLGKQLGTDIAKQGISGHLKLLSATPHSSAIKCLSMLGIGSNNLIKIKTLSHNREAIDIKDLEKQISLLNGQPFILISSAGTVNTVDFDDFVKIKQLKQQHCFWWHIDAAFGGFAACSPRYQHLLNGWEHADSITIDCHKWLNVPYESAVYFIQEKHSLAQIETFQNTNAPYLGDPKDNFNYLNILPENSRRLKALPAWFTLQAYGKQGYQEIVENSIYMAKLLAEFIINNEHFELLAPVHLNTVCFTLADKNTDTPLFLNKLNQSGKVFMTPTVFAGQPAMRAAFVNWRTSEKDIEIAIDEMLKLL